MQGRIAELSDPRERAQALTLAAASLAVHGTPVHVLAASDARAAHLAELLRDPLDALGVGVACVTQAMALRERRAAYAATVVCAAQRVLATDYLRDRMQLGRRQGALRGQLERLAGDAPAAAQLMLRGLHCALVEEADWVMLDEAQAPILITGEMEPGVDRLLCEQALELARALAADTDFSIGAEGVALTESGSRRLAQVAASLGGAWAARNRREALCSAALEALHLLQRERDYRVEQGRVLFPDPEEGAAEPGEDAPLLRCLVELKEGCKLSGQREVLARASLPRFFRRYLHLAGVCADARGLETEFWRLYGLKTTRAGQAAAPVSFASRVFVSAASRHEALLQAVSDLVAGGNSVLVALRSPAAAQTLTAELSGLEQSGAIVATLYPAHRDASRKAAPAAPVHVLAAELHDAERHLAQIRGAHGATSCTVFLALEDEAVAAAIGPLAAAAGRRGARHGGELPAWLAQWIAARAQRGVERARSAPRRAIALRDQQLEDLLAFSGQGD
jgi:preprotein translocase subunit SecA